MRTASCSDGSSHTQILHDQGHTDSAEEEKIQEYKCINTDEAKPKYSAEIKIQYLLKKSMIILAICDTL